MNRFPLPTPHAPMAKLLVVLLLFVGTGCKSGATTAAKESVKTATPTVGAAASATPEVETEIMTPEPTMTAATGPGIAAGSTAQKIRYRFFTIPLDVSPTSLTIDGETAWVTAADDGQIIAVDLTAGAVSHTLDVGGEPYRLTLAFGALWTVDAPFADAWVRRIDPQNGSVLAQYQPPPGTYPAPHRIAAGADSIWVPLEGTGALVSINPATNALSNVITDRPKMSAGEDAPLLAAFGSVWVIDTNEGRLLRIDPQTGKIIATVTDLGHQEENQGGSISVLADGPLALAADEQGVWVLSDVVNPKSSAPNIDGGGALLLIDPTSNQITTRIDTDAEGNGTLAPGLALADGRAWFIDTTGAIIRIDLATGQEVYILPQNRSLIPDAIAVSGNMVWVAAESFGSDPREGLFGINRQAVADFIKQQQ